MFIPVEDDLDGIFLSGGVGYGGALNRKDAGADINPIDDLPEDGFGHSLDLRQVLKGFETGGPTFAERDDIFGQVPLTFKQGGQHNQSGGVDVDLAGRDGLTAEADAVGIGQNALPGGGCTGRLLTGGAG